MDRMAKNTQSLTHICLFSGIGGFSLAASWLGLRTIAQVEIDDYCQEKLAKNFPIVAKYRDVIDYQPQVCDVLTASTPCQPFSVAGEMLGKDDPRHLWHEVNRIISSSRPSLFILENVRGLLSDDKGRTFRYILRDLANLGYDAEWHIIPATAVGGIHQRDRLWLIAYPKGSQWQVTRGTDMQERANIASIREASSARVFGELFKRRSGREIDGLSKRLAAMKSFGCIDSRPLTWNELYQIGDVVMNGDRTASNRNAIKSYGNAIVPQIAYCVLSYGLEIAGLKSGKTTSRLRNCISA